MPRTLKGRKPTPLELQKERVKNWYKVKICVPGQPARYGIFDSFHKLRLPLGVGLVADAVLPVTYRVQLEYVQPLSHVMFGHDYPGRKALFTCNKDDEYERHVVDHGNAAVKLSDSLPPDELAVGKLFSVGVADGSAWYTVTKVGKRRSHYEWRGYCPDRWVDQVLGFKGVLDNSRLLPLVRGSSLRSIFAGRR